MPATKCEKYNRPVLRGYSKSKNAWLLYQPPCKCWDCPTCARLNMYSWAARIGQGYDAYVEQGIIGWRFVTITSNPKLTNMKSTLWVWPKAWGKLSARMRRAFPGIRYALIPELHKNGRVHVHMISSGGLSTKWLKSNAPYCGLGYMAESEEIEEASCAVFYVTKYLAKGLALDKWPKNFRRIRTSQKWPPLEKPEVEISDVDEWIYVTTYPSDGLDYLAEGIAKKTNVGVIVVR